MEVWGKGSARPRLAAKKNTILFLAANPLGTDHVALDEEARAIQAAIERSRYRRRFRFVTRWAVESTDLLRELYRLKPTIVHFSGHAVHGPAPETSSPTTRDCDVGSVPGIRDGEPQQGLILQGLDNRPQFVSLAALREAFHATGSSVRLLVLNACHTDAPVDALPDVECIVGMSGAIHDEAARCFAVSFYTTLAERASVVTAYESGCAAISLVGLHDTHLPQLRVRDGVDAAQIVFPLQEASGSIGGRRSHRKRLAANLIVLALAGSAALLFGQNHSRPLRPPSAPTTAPVATPPLTAPPVLSVSPPAEQRAPSAPLAFAVVIRLHGPNGHTDRVCKDGTVVVDPGTMQNSAKISADGEAHLDIDAQRDGSQVAAIVKCRGLAETATTITIHRGQPVDITVKPPSPPPRHRYTCSWTSSRGVFEGRGDDCRPLGPTSENVTHYNAIKDYEHRAGHPCDIKLDCK
ncbi:MAG TPA: CHAT domain-containing protein [Kofleriaceae bacterium]|jgi:hypothetical protein|nr:CHAT domain-containing protein [Kofleriaceae bacterium]